MQLPSCQHLLQHEMDQKTLKNLKKILTTIYEVLYGAVQQYEKVCIYICKYIYIFVGLLEFQRI